MADGREGSAGVGLCSVPFPLHAVEVNDLGSCCNTQCERRLSRG